MCPHVHVSSITASTCMLNCTNGGTPDNSDCTRCMCPIGFTGDLCDVDINDCVSNPCVNGNCTDMVAGYTCVCDPFWTGTNCDTCLISNCARCDSKMNPPVCVLCNTGFRLPNCTKVCSPNPCQNGGTCSPQGSSDFTCMCPRGWTGTTCTMCAKGMEH